MKLSKNPLQLLIPILIVVLLSITAFFLTQNTAKSQLQPLSDKNEFQNQLDYALKLAGITPLRYQYRDYLDQIEFSLNRNNQRTTIYLSTQKNPLWQVASLQKILKIATMKGKDVKLVDLSQKHPYVTLENN